MSVSKMLMRAFTCFIVFILLISGCTPSSPSQLDSGLPSKNVSKLDSGTADTKSTRPHESNSKRDSSSKLLKIVSKEAVQFDYIPPFKDVPLESDKKRIDPSESQLVYFKNGTTINIPEEAFTDADGNVITTPVTLSLTTYNNAATIVASGIPMAYHDGLSTQYFESAGMFQIRGSAAGKDVFIRKGKELGINYPSTTAGNYDFFYLNEDLDGPSQKASWQKLSGIQKREENPLKPANLGSYKLQFDTARYPELLEIESIQWQVGSTHGSPLKSENAWVLDKTWTTIEITKPKYGLGTYMAKMKKPFEYQNRLFVTNKDSTKIAFISFDGLHIVNLENGFTKSIDVKALTQGNQLKSLGDCILVNNKENNQIFDFNGRRILNTEPGYNFRFFPDGQHFVCKNAQPILHIYTLQGEKVKDIAIKPVKSAERGYISLPYDFPSSETIIVNAENGIELYNTQGTRIKQKTGLYAGVKCIQPGMALLTEDDGRLTVWNYQTEETITSKLPVKDTQNRVIREYEPTCHSKVYPEHHLVIVNEKSPKHSTIWDYEKNEINILDFRIMAQDTLTTPPSSRLLPVLGYNRNNEMACIYDIVKRKNIVEFQVPYIVDHLLYNSYSLSSNKEATQFLTNVRQQIGHYDSDGNHLKDYKQYDSLTSRAFFSRKGTIITTSPYDQFHTWSPQGELLSSNREKSLEPFTSTGHKNQISSYFHYMPFIKNYNPSGNLINHSAFFGPFKDFLFGYSIEFTYSLHKRFLLPDNVYQLNLENKKDYNTKGGRSFFTTYCYLSPEDQKKIDKYTSIKARKLQIERRTAKITRSFAIKNFGIYNWDRFYKDESRIRFAASFDFGVPTDFNGITVFLITEVNGTSVIKFYDGSWDKFTIDPKVNNQLLAVLPENKVAYLGNKDLKQLDWAAIEKNGENKFQMKVSEEPVANLLQLNEVIN